MSELENILSDCMHSIPIIPQMHNLVFCVFLLTNNSINLKFANEIGSCWSWPRYVLDWIIKGNLYTGMSLLKSFNLSIDVIDLLPTPFGLVRSGVAPDHQHVKNVMVKFNDFLKMPNVGYYGGVQLGTLRLKDLRKAYNGVVLGYGSGLSNTLGLNSSNLKGIYSANSIVGWYNGHPDYFKEISDLKLDLNCESVIIIWNGNVALDIARILIKDPNVFY